MKLLVLGLLTTVCATVAFAGKEERDIITKEVAPAMRKAEATWKASCGCPLGIAMDEASVKIKEDLYSTMHFAEELDSNIAGYCTDGASKKAMCQMKSVVVRGAAEATFAFKAGQGVATVHGGSLPSFEMITRELDK